MPTFVCLAKLSLVTAGHMACESMLAPNCQHAFQKVDVRVKPEIVHADLPHICPNRRTGTRFFSGRNYQTLPTGEHCCRAVADALASRGE